jgi:prepilin-type N-terminal cleavage/methylation domain-containing protein
MSHARGMTIIEVLVAVLVLSVGLLALTTTAAGVSRMIDDGRRSTEAAALAAERIELLRASGCPAVGTGSATRGSFAVSWNVEAPSGDRRRTITVAVTRATRRGGADTVRTAHTCP